MANSRDENKGTPVKKLSNGDGKKKAKTGKPRRIVTSSMRSRFASGGGIGTANTMEGVGGNFYSPELSTDFLELPQSLHEKWNYYRFFAENEPFVGQALELHSELPISKVRIGIPDVQEGNEELARSAAKFCEAWAKRVGLVHRLISIVWERNLIGEVFIWMEDANEDMPEGIRTEIRRTLTEEGEAIEEEIERKDADERASKWLRKNYKGWTSVRCLPPEQVRMQTFNFTDEKIFELIPDSATKAVIEKAAQGDKDSIRVVNSMPPEVVRAVGGGGNIPLNTDPDAGSFVHYIANKKSDYQPRGRSMLQRCIRILVYRDKLRQAQTSIASRHMTPIRIVYGEGLNQGDIDSLREQVDNALQDPDYSIIANFEVRWEEMGADGRLLDLSGEYDMTDRQMYAGLGVTEGLLTGESAYSGDRISLDVINTRYMLLREQLQELVEEFMFRPMCARMGFVEIDADGEETVIVPSLSFTRLALKDNRDSFDALYNLYTKGSLDVDTILEMLNLDPVEIKRKIERDLLGVNDPNFNEVMRGIYGDVGRAIAENSDAPQKIAKTIGLKNSKPDEGGGRFASAKVKTASGADQDMELSPEYEELARTLISGLWSMQQKGLGQKDEDDEG